MKKNIWKSSMALLFIFMLLAGCQPHVGKQAAADSKASDKNPLANKKVALIMQQNLGTFSAQYIDGVKEQAAKFGGKVTVFTSDGDLAKMSSNVDAAINQGFDAILIDHGTKEALTAGVKKAIDKKIPVIAFDAEVSVPGVTVLEQGDQQMAKATLEKLAKDSGGKANIVKIWVAGFAPMERRQIAYKDFLAKNTGIKEISAFGAATQNTALDTQSQMEAILKQYPKKGQITAVWASWDEFAKGAVRAIKQAGRTDIKVYGIDMSDEDLQMIQDKNSPWVASAAVDPKDIGRIQVRYAYQKLSSGSAPRAVKLNPVFITKEELPAEQITTAELNKYVKGWGHSEQGYTEKLKDLENGK